MMAGVEPDNAVPLTPAQFADLFLSRRRLPAGRSVRGLCGRFIRGTKPADFEVLSDEPGKKLSWVCSPDMLGSVLGYNPTEAMMSIGFRTPWLKARLDDGTAHQLVVFPTTADTTVVTWAGLWGLISRAFGPEIDDALEPFKQQIEQLDTSNGYFAIDPEGTINRLGTLPVVEKYAHPGYLTSDRFLSTKVRTLYHARGFLDHAIGCNYRCVRRPLCCEGSGQGSEVVEQDVYALCGQPVPLCEHSWWMKHGTPWITPQVYWNGAQPGRCCRNDDGQPTDC
jgi:hypothetical protein